MESPHCFARECCWCLRYFGAIGMGGIMGLLAAWGLGGLTGIFMQESTTEGSSQDKKGGTLGVPKPHDSKDV